MKQKNKKQGELINEIKNLFIAANKKKSRNKGTSNIRKVVYNHR